MGFEKCLYAKKKKKLLAWQLYKNDIFVQVSSSDGKKKINHHLPEVNNEICVF